MNGELNEVKLKEKTVEGVILRMILVTNAKNQEEMIRKIGYASGSASNWKNRGNVPDKAIAAAAEVSATSFRWVKTGEKETTTKPKQQPSLSEEEQCLLDAYRCAGDDARDTAMYGLKKSYLWQM